MKLFIAFFISSLLISCVSYANVNNGLVAYYPFDGDIQDYSGFGNNGSLHGSELSKALTFDRFGKSSKAILFDGNDDFIEIPCSDSDDISKGVTISAWINIAESLGGGFPQHYLLDTRGSGGGHGLNIDTNSAQFWVGGKGSTFNVKIKVKSWHHIAGTYDGNYMKLFIDGVEVGSSHVDTTFTDGSGTMYIGQRFNDKERFHGAIDELRIYGKVLTEFEIQQLSLDSFYKSETSTTVSKLKSNTATSKYTIITKDGEHIETEFYMYQGNELCYSTASGEKCIPRTIVDREAMRKFEAEKALDLAKKTSTKRPVRQTKQTKKRPLSRIHRIICSIVAAVMML